MKGDKRFPRMSQASESEIGEERDFERESRSRVHDRSVTCDRSDLRALFACRGVMASRAKVARLKFLLREIKNYGSVKSEFDCLSQAMLATGSPR
jgi:hypothetical protein